MSKVERRSFTINRSVDGDVTKRYKQPFEGLQPTSSGILRRLALQLSLFGKACLSLYAFAANLFRHRSEGLRSCGGEVAAPCRAGEGTAL